MAISITARTRIGSQTDALTYTTNAGGDGDGTFTPSANSLLMAFIGSSGTGSAADSVAGHGATWSRIDQGSWPTLGGVTELWAAFAGASPTDDTVTVTYSGTNRGSGIILVSEVTGAYVSGTVAQAFAQHVPNNGNSTTPAVTLSSASNSANRAYMGAIMAQTSGTLTAGTNFTALAPGNVASGSPPREGRDEWRSDAFDTGPNMSMSSGTAAEWTAIAVEIVDASAGTASADHVVLTTTPTLPQASLTNALTDVVLETTPSLPAAAISQEPGHVVLTTTPSLPAASLTTALTGIVLTTTPEQPVASIGQAGSVTALLYQVTPTLPAASISAVSVTASGSGHMTGPVRVGRRFIMLGPGEGTIR